MQITDRIKEQLGSWWSLWVPFIESPEWDKIFIFLKSESGKGKILIPKAPDLFRSFEYTDREKMRALIILMDPYPTFKGDIMVADGCPISCANTSVLQPSLQLFYEAVESLYAGFDPDMEYKPDNSYLLKEEHVMLLNSSLSVQKDMVGSHTAIWQPFMQFFIEEIINKYYRGLPILLLGTSAQKLEKYINPMLHHIIKAEHPAAAAHGNRSWNHLECLKIIDRIVQDNNGSSEAIRWYRRKNEDKTPPPWVTGKKQVHTIDSTNQGMPWEE